MKIANLTELDTAVRMKDKGYTLVAQFRKERAHFDPLYFKTTALFSRMCREDLKDWKLVWVKPIDKFIAEIETNGLTIA